MKLLENQTLSRLGSIISGQHDTQRVDCRLESYSCKMAGPDKKMYKQLASEEGSLQDLELLSPSPLSPPAFSPPGSAGASSHTSRHATSKKTLYFLKATLNASYSPDYDFSFSKAIEFSRESSYSFVCRNIEANLIPALGLEYETVRQNLWAALEAEIHPDECEIYSFLGDSQDDPFSEPGTVWSFVYLFYNKKLKRVLLFTCQGLNRVADGIDEGMDDMPDDIMFGEPADYTDY
eukprot:TRINITY_DN2996_c0_g1_i1.p1 TRINITY_DN2996_c0_g1~~TRINITY_DN2996_c0_g1_i1.p1  ORF type:complete len:235 (+),score=34.39 TRINITY_DN2996_c0_g1_i1:162-866(+)